jgi:hypothetical protein
MLKIRGKRDLPAWKGFLLLIDILANLLTGGFYGETISSRVGKGVLYGKKQYIIARKVIDYLFLCRFIPKSYRFPNHCQEVINWYVGYTDVEVVKLVMKYRGVHEKMAWHIVRTAGLEHNGYKGGIEI